MFELFSMLILGACYISARKREKEEEELQKREEHILDLKTKVFRYAVSKRIPYESVADDIKTGKLTFEDIDEYLERK